MPDPTGHRRSKPSSRRKPTTRKPPIANTYWRGPPGREVLWARLEIKGKPIRWSLRLEYPLRPGDVDVARGRIETRRKELIAAVHYGDARKRYVDVLTAWVEHFIMHEVAETTALRYEVSLRQLKPYLVDLFIDQLDRRKMGEIVEKRREAGASTATIRRDLTALSSVIEYAIAEEWLETDHNPALARLRRLKERRDPIVLPDHAHIARVIADAPPALAPLIEAGLKTGCRLNELTTAERTSIDHNLRQLTVNKGKGSKLRVIDLVTPAGDAYAVLRAAPARLGCRWVFWHHDGERYRAASQGFGQHIEAVMAAAQAEAKAAGHDAPDFRPFPFHHLRHRFAVDFLKAGGSIYKLQKHLGHTSVQTTEIYLKYLTPEEERRVKAGAESQMESQPQRFGA